MRLRALRLERFGHFTGAALDFGGGEADLHVVFGRNEAGKTTLGRAIRAALYGIPARTGDAHLHEPRRLRLGATLERDGETLALVRRKGNKRTLLDRAGEPLDPAALAPYLAGVGPELFEALFALTHDRLEKGGEELLAGRGEVGESLFGAGMAGGIHDLLASLRRRADAIFSPRGQRPPLNAALRAFAEARREVEAASLRPRDWETLERELRETQRELERRESEHRELLARRARLERIARTRPVLSERAELSARLEALGDVPLLRESAQRERERALETLESCALRAAKLESERRLMLEQREKLHVPGALLARESDVAELADRLGAHRKALADLPKLKGRVETHRDAARAALRGLGRDDSLDGVDRLRITAQAQARIRKLTREGIELWSELRHARDGLREARERREALESALESVPDGRDPDPLVRFARSARQRGDLEARQRERESRRAALDADVAARARALERFAGTPDALRGLPLPAPEQVARFDAELAESGHARRAAESRERELRARRAELRRQLDLFAGDDPLPTETALQRARRRRERAWREVRAAWLEGRELRRATPETLAATLETRTREADEIGDRLRTDADRVAQRDALERETERWNAQHRELADELESLGERERSLRSEWERLWEPAGVEPGSPAEMRPWLERHAELMRVLDERDEVRESCATGAGERDELVARARALLAATGEATPDGESLAELLDRSEATAERLEAARRERARLEDELEAARARHAGAEAECARRERALESWRAGWAEAVAPLGLDPEVGGEEVEAVVAELGTLFEHVDALRADERRIASIGADAEAFERSVGELVRELAPDLLELPATQAADAISLRLREGRESAAQRVQLDARLEEMRSDRDDIRAERARAEASLEHLVAEAGCRDPDALPAAEEQSRERRAGIERLRGLETQLSREPIALAELEREAAAADADSLPGELDAVGHAVDESERARGELAERIGTLRARLERMDGGAAAAEAAARAQEQLGAVHAHVESYARARLAAILLEREVERYRNRYQRPIQDRAAEVFRRVTLGRYTAIETDFEADDRPLLLCIARDGRRLHADELSDGTRNQLFLALRLASLELFLDRGEPLPVVLDDILIKFDDDRAAATLAVLAELSTRAQILFLTHHRRLVDLARDSVPAGRLTLHEL